MASLTVVIITFNEGEHILRCIESSRRVANEIVVVDSYSTDSTKDICLSMGITFIEHKFTGFGNQKNTAVNAASSDFVLNLDADEYLSDELVDKILAQKAAGFPYDAYTMNRLNRYCGQWIRHGCWYPDRKLRLYNRNKGKWSDKVVHEHVHMRAGTSQFHLAADLLHLAYDSLEQHLSKNEKYSTLSAGEMFQQGRQTNRYLQAVKTAWSFFNCYFIRLGFLDGRNGYIIAKNVAVLTYWKNEKLLKLRRQAKMPGSQAINRNR